jgi:RNA polymerase sigma factor (sigma-70 family)
MIQLDLSPPSPKWPVRLCELCTVLGGHPAPDDRDSACGEAWVLLNVSLRRYLRLHASRLGRIPATDIEDIAASKALDLIRQAESGKSRALTRRSHELPAFLSTVARNGLVDHLRRTARLVPLEDRDSENGHPTPQALTASASGDPDRAAECTEFAAALCECADVLRPRARLIWFFRVFYELSTKEIANHPEVQLNPGHVDVVLQRAREHVTRCMKSKGHIAQDMPPGTFAELLRVYRLESPIQRGVA